jgi:hypothetical protein
MLGDEPTAQGYWDFRNKDPEKSKLNLVNPTNFKPLVDSGDCGLSYQTISCYGEGLGSKKNQKFKIELQSRLKPLEKSTIRSRSQVLCIHRSYDQEVLISHHFTSPEYHSG